MKLMKLQCEKCVLLMYRVSRERVADVTVPVHRLRPLRCSCTCVMLGGARRVGSFSAFSSVCYMCYNGPFLHLALMLSGKKETPTLTFCLVVYRNTRLLLQMGTV